MPRQLLRLADVDGLQASTEAAQALPLKFQVAADPQSFPRVPIAAIRGEQTDVFLKHYLHPPAPMPWAGLMEVEDALVLPDGLVVKGERLLVGNSLMYPQVAFPFVISTLAFERQETGGWSVEAPEVHLRLPGTTVNLMCYGWQIYGHWLVDVLPRLQRLLESGVCFDTLMFVGPSRPWQLKMLEAVGAPLDKCRFVELSGSTWCERLLVPTFDRFNSEVRPEIASIFRQLRTELWDEVAQPRTRNLFVSRRRWGGSRPLADRAEIEAVVESLGFEITNPEDYSFADQVRLFASARRVIGECGSGLHNALFCAPGTRVGVLQSCSNTNYIQAQVGTLLGHQLYFCIGSHEDEHAGFSVRLEDVEAIGRAMLDETERSPEVVPPPPALPRPLLQPPPAADGLTPLNAPSPAPASGLRRLLARLRS